MTLTLEPTADVVKLLRDDGLLVGQPLAHGVHVEVEGGVLLLDLLQHVHLGFGGFLLGGGGVVGGGLVPVVGGHDAGGEDGGRGGHAP